MIYCNLKRTLRRKCKTLKLSFVGFFKARVEINELIFYIYKCLKDFYREEVSSPFSKMSGDQQKIHR